RRNGQSKTLPTVKTAKKPKKPKDSQRESRIQTALFAKKYNIANSTLAARWNNQTKSRAEADTDCQFLSPAKERVLATWIEYLGCIGVPLSKRAIRLRAAQLRSDRKKPSRNWIPLFLARHPEIKLATAHGLDPKRAQAFNKPVVGRYFDKLEELVQRYDIPVENIYNMDEKGCQRGGGKKTAGVKYFFGRQQRTRYRHRSANLELVTILEAVCADGSSLLPGFVFPGVEQSPEWFDEDLAILICMSATGWTDNHISVQWFKKCFIPQAKAWAKEKGTNDQPILLVLDGHGSHEALELIDLARENNIILLLLPPHTTHKLQPLDVGVFGPFSRAWTEKCDDVVDDTTKEMPKEDFVKHYMDVRRQTFKPATIQTAFRKSGLFPINRAAFNDEDYATSVPFSTTARDIPVAPQFEPYTPFQLPADPDDKDHWSRDFFDEDDPEYDASDVDARPYNPVLDHPQAGAELPPLTPTLFASPPSCQNSNLPSIMPSNFYYNAALFERIKDLETQMHAMEAHMTLLDTRSNQPSKKRKLNVDARCLTSEEGRELAAQQEEERSAKAQEKADNAAQAKKKEIDAVVRRQTRDANEPFVGLLTSRSKELLVDVAFDLQLPQEKLKLKCDNQPKNKVEKRSEFEDWRIQPSSYSIYTQIQSESYLQLMSHRAMYRMERWSWVVVEPSGAYVAQPRIDEDNP
ncbi:unnamed protein product, partial [Mycena citricolor]